MTAMEQDWSLITVTEDQVAKGNTQILEIKQMNEAQLQQLTIQIEKFNLAVEPLESKAKGEQAQITQLKKEALRMTSAPAAPVVPATVASASTTASTTAQGSESSPVTGIVAGLGPVPVRQRTSRYRFPSQQEKEAKEAAKKQELCLEEARDFEVLRASKDHNEKLQELLLRIAELEGQHNGTLTELASAVSKLGQTCSPNLKAVAQLRAQLLEKKAKLDQAYLDTKTKAEEEFKAKILKEETLSRDRSLVYFITDVLAMHHWMMDASADLSAREEMNKLEYQQKIGCKEFALVENLVVYSKNQEQIVHMKKVNGKWDFFRYYEKCSLAYAQELFVKCQGRPVSALPAAPTSSEYVTTTL